MIGLMLSVDGVLPCPAGDIDGSGDITIDEIIVAVNRALNGCPPPVATPTPTPTGTAEEFIAQASDFECLTHWQKNRQYRLTNKLGHLPEALGVASASYDVSHLHFPVGTIVQLIPGEAMVKRGGNFDPANGDWEYFTLQASRKGTKISARGRDQVNGGACFSCHSAARSYDFICESVHGCVPLMITDELVDLLQASDPRCTP